ncbi:MAG TPA: hypothetical protein VJA20_00590 [Candidatus Nanoarchaeia archaeon]|nr:hypothetical protein [Candidatus Nanoarchaeia archaeon]
MAQSQIFISLLFPTIVVAIYVIFIWKLHIFISTKNILRLNLNKYNKSTHPALAKIFAGFLYFLEYLIILPILIFFWFLIFAILLVFIARGMEPGAIILLAAITIAVLRVVSYIPKYGENASGEAAKVIPFTLLAIGLTEPLFFNSEEILARVSDIPQLFQGISPYIYFIVAIELILRSSNFLLSMFEKKGGTELEEDVEEN